MNKIQKNKIAKELKNKSILDLINAANRIKNFGIITAKINKFNYKE